MNYYKRHLGDYARDTGHLSVLEHGIYTLLLDAYYSREQAPTRAEALRIGRARNEAEIASVDAVLADFFTEVDGRFRQSRVEAEFVKAEEQARINQENGRRGGRPRKPKGNRKETERVTNGNRNESENNPNPLIHQSTKKEQEQKQPQAALPACPEWLDSEAWTGFIAMRVKERHPMTSRAATLILKKLDDLKSEGHDPTAILDQSTRNGWRDVFAPKPNGATHARPEKESHAARITRKYLAEQADAERADRAIGHDDAEPVDDVISPVWSQVVQRMR